MGAQDRLLHIQDNSHMVYRGTRTLAFEKELTSWSLHFTYSGVLAELNTDISQKDSTSEAFEVVYKQEITTTTYRHPRTG